MVAPQGRTAVYRLYDRESTLIYIGISNNPPFRFEDHARKPWWPEVATREIEWYDTRAAAEREEREAIAIRRPKYNEYPGMPEPGTPAFSDSRKRPGWTPTQDLLDLFARHDEELRVAGRTRDLIEARLTAVLRQGVTASRIAKFVPWRAPTVLQLAKKAGIPSQPLPGSDAYAARQPDAG